MKTKWLFEQSMKKWGWVLFFPMLILGVLRWHYEFRLEFLEIPDTSFFGTNQNLTEELVITGLITSLFLVGFSKVKGEDEMIYSIRSQALHFGIYIHYVLIILATLMVYDIHYFTVMAYNIFTPLFVYVIVFHIQLWKVRRIRGEE